MLGGITGHKDFARDTGVVVKPADATKVADAVVRVFIDHGDRTNRTKARLKYVLDALGIEKFLALIEEKLGRKLDARAAGSARAAPGLRPRRAYRRASRRSRTGLNWIGVVLPVGKLTAAQMRGLAGIARDARRRRYPPHGLAEPADLRRARRQGSKRARGGDRGARALDSAHARSAPASSPAPAMSAASSPPPTPSATPRRSRAGARRASSSTARSTSISPAATIPARSTTSATSACSPARCRPRRTATRSRAITSWSAAASARTRRSAREIYRDVKAEDAPQTVERMLKAYLAHRASPRGDLPRLRAPARGRGAQGDVRRGGGGMTHRRRAADPALIPESAPFTPEQRAWLNGFFAGLSRSTARRHGAVARAEPPR